MIEREARVFQLAARLIGEAIGDLIGKEQAMSAWCYVWVIGSSAVMLTVNVLAIL